MKLYFTKGYKRFPEVGNFLKSPASKLCKLMLLFNRSEFPFQAMHQYFVELVWIEYY